MIFLFSQKMKKKDGNEKRRNEGGTKRGKKKEKTNKRVIQNHGQHFELLGQLTLFYSISLGWCYVASSK